MGAESLQTTWRTAIFHEHRKGSGNEAKKVKSRYMGYIINKSRVQNKKSSIKRLNYSMSAFPEHNFLFWPNNKQAVNANRNFCFWGFIIDRVEAFQIT